MKFSVEDQDLADRMREYVRAHGTEIKDDQAIAITLPGTTAKEPQKCQSGSGVMTSGGRFAPGGDAKLKSALFAIIRGTPDKVPPELVQFGPMYKPLSEWTPEAAVEALDHYGWPHPTPPKPKKERAPKADKGDGSTNSDGATETGQTKASRRRMSKAAAAEAEAAKNAEVEREGETDLTEAQLAEANAEV